MPQKHILVISQYFYPEPFRINDMCVEWVSRGYKVTVLTGIPNYPEGKFYSGYGWGKNRKETWNGVEIRRIPLLARGKSAFGLVCNYLSFVISGWLWKCFTDLKPDYIYTFEVSPMTQALIGVWFSQKRKIPHYLYVQDLWPENVEIVTGIHSKVIIDPIRKMVDYIYRRTDVIFATSPNFVKQIQERIPGEEDKVYYLPQYAEAFYQPMERQPVDEIPDDDRFKIIFTGNVGVAQGLDILPRTAQHLKTQGIEDVCFVIVGNGRYHEQLVRDIQERDVSDFFVLVGRRKPEEIPRYLAACDVAFVSFMDNALFANTIPAKLQSYMACGMPILASAIGETERIVREASCGLCCAIGDAQALADAVVELKSKNLSVYAAASREYCTKHFHKQRVMDDLDRFFS